MSSQGAFGQHLTNAASQQSAPSGSAIAGKSGEEEEDIPELEPVEGAEKKVEEEDDDGEVSETGVDDKEVELVMNQVRIRSISSNKC